MKYIDILANFEIEINKIDDTFGKPAVDDSLFWLNQSIYKFIKLRFNGDFVHHTGFEETEKRRSDLIRLFKSITYKETTGKIDYLDSDINQDGQVDSQDLIIMNEALQSGESKYNNREDVNKDGKIDTQDLMKLNQDLGKVPTFNIKQHPDYDEYSIIYPEDFLYVLNEDVVITDTNGGNKKDTCVFECTRDSFMYRINNSLTDFHYRNHRARPLRIRNAEGCSLLTDKHYNIQQYTLGYLRKPEELVNSKLSSEEYNKEYPDFSNETMYEIIKMAAQMYVENQGEERYKSLTQEVLTQE